MHKMRQKIDRLNAEFYFSKTLKANQNIL